MPLSHLRASVGSPDPRAPHPLPQRQVPVAVLVPCKAQSPEGQGQMTNLPNKPWFTVEEFSELAGPPPDTLRQRIREGKLAAVKDGQRWYIRRQAAEEYLAGRARSGRSLADCAPPLKHYANFAGERR